jgi:hypothetical protein
MRRILLASALLSWSAGFSQVVDGYVDPYSTFAGDSIDLFLNGFRKNDQYSLRLYDINGTLVSTFTVPIFPQIEAKKSYVNGFGYELTARVKVPELKSGIYRFENNIPFIVKKNDSKIVVLYALNTANAYCNSGGKSLYEYNSTDDEASPILSMSRPIPLSRHCESFHQWLATQDLEDVGYITDVDMDEFHHLKKAKLLIIPGHSEYWTVQARKNFDRFVQEGNDALILSGNTMWWQVRYNRTRDQLICYRTTKGDPIKNPKLKTILWNDVSLNYPITSSIGADFSYGGYGLKNDKGWDGYKIVTNSPLLAETNIFAGSILQCPSDELDGAPLTGFQNGRPIINNDALGFEKVEIVGYDRTSRGVATWIVFKKTKNSGIVINTASTDWCSYRGIGTSESIQKITKTMIIKLLNKEEVFSPVEDASPVLN